MNMTDYYETAMINTMRSITAPAPAAVYLALYLSDPTDTGTGGTEVSYTGYARRPVTLSAPETEGMNVRVRNLAEIIFATPGGSAGTVTHAGLMSAATGGNMLVHAPLINPIPMTAEVSPRFAAGNIQLSMNGGNLDPAYKTRILNYLRGTTIQGFEPFLAMFDGDPTSGGAELSGAGYARLPVAFDAPAEQVSGFMQAQNHNSVESAAAVVNWGSWAFGVIMDAAAGGGRVWYRQNLASYSMHNNAKAYIRPGDIAIALN